MFEILKLLNENEDRCVLIGRNGLNYIYSRENTEKMQFSTVDFDVLCPNVGAARECAGILKQRGFSNIAATFRDGKNGEIDILIADPEYPEGILDGFYNLPALTRLWETRTREDGILVPDKEVLIMNKLLFARDNEGKDFETIRVYFSLEPEKIDHIIGRIGNHSPAGERETMLFSLYACFEGNEDIRLKIEEILISEILYRTDESV